MKLDAMNRFTATVSRRLFGKPMQEADAGLCSFEVEADAVMSRQRTQRAQTIVRTAVGVVALLILWASLAHVDELVLDWIDSPAFRTMLTSTIQQTYPPHEWDKFEGHFGGLIDLWVKDERSVLGKA